MKTLPTNLPPALAADQIHLDDTKRTYCTHDGKKYRVRTYAIETAPRKFTRFYFPDFSRPVDRPEA
jgi:hypothetical protein